MTKHFVVGAGGVACWVVPLLQKMMVPGDEIHIIDGDKLEQRNFDRQLHSIECLGWNKAEALAYQHATGHFYPRYLSKLTRPQGATEDDWLWCCVDNHAARSECLDWIDEVSMAGIFGGNEYESAQAFFYFEPWKGTPLDPRIRFPEILIDKTNDPVHPNCQGQEQVIHPQLALFNYLAAGQMMHLYYFWSQNHQMTDMNLYPVEHTSNFVRTQTTLRGAIQHVDDIFKEGESDDVQPVPGRTQPYPGT